VLRRWLNYYCKFYASLAIHTIFRAVNFALVRWARRKFKKLNRSYSRARDLIRRMQKQNSILFEHWENAKGI
jgi:RNA-directed DNA polymerase